ncbi:MAG: ABC transporter permease [Candidatus Norongarragalinales archaeon]
MNYFFIATRNLLHRKLRSMLTIIGIFIGIAAVVALVSLSTGLNNVIASEFEKLGSDKIIIMGVAGGRLSSPFASEISAHPLNEDDVRLIKNIKGVKTVGPLLMKSALIEYGGEAKNSFALGLPTDAQTMQMLKSAQAAEIAVGRDFKPSDKYKAAIGSYAADGLFKRKIRVGSTIKINGKEFEVIAVLKSVGTRTDDSAFYIPMDTARELFNEPKLASMIIAQVEKSAEPAKVGAEINKRMRQRRDQKEGEEDFLVQTPEQLQATFSSILAVVQLVIIGIAAISLLVGGIGIMNTMYTSVLERTREIGIMKAVGARNRDVLFIFLTESGLLGMIGGAIGVSIGVGLAFAAQVAAEQAGLSLFKANFDPALIISALAFSFVVGALSGALPARQAARLKPAEALRYE